jgi:hypothetical protein
MQRGQRHTPVQSEARGRDGDSHWLEEVVEQLGCLLTESDRMNYRPVIILPRCVLVSPLIPYLLSQNPLFHTF